MVFHISLLDINASPIGDLWDHTQAALLLFLKSLPEGSYFQVIGYGTDFESVFAGSVEYNDEKLQAASWAVASWGANLGGTQVTYLV